MVMMEEFRRRKNLKDYYELMSANDRRSATAQRAEELAPFDMHPDARSKFEIYHGSNEERFFEPKHDEIFDPR